jgi:hypothetical protein
MEEKPPLIEQTIKVREGDALELIVDEKVQERYVVPMGVAAVRVTTFGHGPCVAGPICEPAMSGAPVVYCDRPLSEILAEGNFDHYDED